MSENGQEARCFARRQYHGVLSTLSKRVKGYPFGSMAPIILAHMNTGHTDTLRAFCRQVHGIETPSAQRVGVDPDGFDVRAEPGLSRFDFAAPTADAQAARQALLALARAVRA